MIDDFKLVSDDIDDFVYQPKAGMGGLIKWAESETMWQNVIKLKHVSKSYQFETMFQNFINLNCPFSALHKFLCEVKSEASNAV